MRYYAEGIAARRMRAILAIVSWTRFGGLHEVYVDAPEAEAGHPHRHKLERHQPFHFHEFFHYYLGSNYFGSFGYEGLYDFAALGDFENAQAQGVPPRVRSGWVRDLDDVLRDKPYEDALENCRAEYLPHVAPERWAAFKADLVSLQRIVPDDWWNDVVYDAGFNPPPSWVLIGGSIANVVPIWLGQRPSYLFATSLDMVLVVACFLALRASFGTSAACVAAVYFGASFIASYGWNGGAYLRYTWVTAIVLGLAAARRGRWILAGALLGAATCDRIFPAGFAVGLALPVAWRALKSDDDRRRLLRFGAGFLGTMVVLVLASSIVYGLDAWRVFFTRIGRHGDVYYTMHIGLKKVMSFRDWTPSQNFHGHEGLMRFRDWNLRLREAWAATRWLVIPVQLAAVVGAGAAAIRRRPHEAAVLVGAVAMFCFSLPANYYWVVLALVPALLLRAAMTGPTLYARVRDWTVLTAFTLFWLTTMLAPRMFGDDIIFNHFICAALLIFLAGWIVVWLPWPKPLIDRLARRAVAAAAE